MQIKLKTSRFQLTPSSEFKDYANVGTVNKNNCLCALFDYLSPKEGPIFNAVDW